MRASRLALLAVSLVCLSSCSKREQSATAPRQHTVRGFALHGASAEAHFKQHTARVGPGGVLEMQWPHERGGVVPVVFKPARVTRGERGPSANDLSPVTIGTDGQAVVDHGGWRDLVRVGATELEQSWEFVGPLAGEGALQVAVPVEGASVARVDDQGLHFKAGDAIRLHYSHATWVDAEKRATAIRGSFVDGAIRFQVPNDVLETTHWPAVLDPTVTAELELDAPTYSGQDDTFAYVVAPGGEGYLVTWAVPLTVDQIKGARVLLDGGVLDPLGFVIANQGDSNGYRTPQVAYSATPDGGLFLVTWEHANFGSSDMWGARVEPNWSGAAVVKNSAGTATINGNLLFTDTHTDCGANGCYAYPMQPALAGGPNGFLIAWRTNVFDSLTDTRSDIDARRIPFYGSVGATFKVFTSTASEWADEPTVGALPSGQFAVAWSETNSNGYQTRARLVPASGTTVSSVAIAGTANINPTAPRLACTAAQCLVVWQADGPMGSAIQGQRFDGAGVSPDGVNPLSFGAPATFSETAPRVAAGSSDYLVSWARSASGMVSRMGEAGAPTTPQTWSTVALGAMASGGSGNGLGLYTVSSKLRARLTSPTLASGTEFLLGRAPAVASVLATEWDSRVFRSVWFEANFLRSNSINALGLLASPTANTTLGAGGFNLPGSVHLSRGDGGVLLSNSYDGTPNFRFLRADGGMTSIATFSATGVVSNLVGAPSASGAVALWQNSTSDIYAKYLLSDFSAFNGANPPVAIATTSLTQRDPAVASNGTNYHAVWEENDGGAARLMGTRITGTRVVDTVGGAVSSSDYRTPLHAVIASDGLNYLAVWRGATDGGTGDLMGRLISSTGTFLSADMPIIVAPGDQSEPALTFDGTNYLLVWTDNRAGNLDVYASQVTPGGLSQGEFVVAGTTDSESAPSVASRSGSMSVVSYLRFVPGTTHNTNRARARVVTFGANFQANSQFLNTPYNTPLPITLTGSLPDGGTGVGAAADGGNVLSFVIQRSPTRGTLSGAAPTLTYTPTLNLSGFDSFDFTVTDGFTSSLGARINIQVAGPIIDAGAPVDAGIDAGRPDAGVDAGVSPDAGSDAGTPPDAGSDAGAVVDAGLDAGSADAGRDGGADAGTPVDAGVDAGATPGDAGSDAGLAVDAGSPDAGGADSGQVDAGDVDAGSVSDAGIADAGHDAGAPDAAVADAGDVDAGVATGGGSAQGGGSAVGGGSDTGGGSAAGGGAETGGGAQTGGGTNDVPDAGAGQESLYSWKGFGCGCQGGSGGSAMPLFGAMALWLLRRRRTAAAVLAGGLLSASPARAESPETLRLLFAGVSCPSPNTKNQAQALEEFIQTELVKLKVYSVISANDVSALMGIERQKQLMGCNDDTSCFSEIGGALNARRALTASLTQLGQSYLLNLTLLDTGSGKPLGRVGRRIKGDAGLESGLDEIEPMLRELLGQDTAVKLPAASAPQVVARAPVDPQTGLKNEFTIGLRAEFETLGTAFAPAVTGTFTRGIWGLAATGIIAPHPGLRVEGRVLPFSWKVRPYLGVGVTSMIPAVAGRGALGATTNVGPIALSADVAAEYAFVVPAGYRPLAVLASVGAGWVF